MEHDFILVDQLVEESDIEDNSIASRFHENTNNDTTSPTGASPHSYSLKINSNIPNNNNNNGEDDDDDDDDDDDNYFLRSPSLTYTNSPIVQQIHSSTINNNSNLN